MNAEALRQERRQNLIDALSFKEPKKIPVGAEVLSWPFAYANVKYADIMDDPEAVAREYVKFLDVIELDFLHGGSISQPVRFYEALGVTNFKIGADGVVVVHLQPEIEFMTADEYPELIADPTGFREKLVRRRCSAFDLPKEEAYEKVKEALIGLNTWMKANALITAYVREEKGLIPLVGSPLRFTNPLTTIFDRLRGMKDTLVDLRRRPEVVKEAYNALLEFSKAEFAKYDPKDFTEPHPLGNSTYHVECFLSPPLFDEYYFDAFSETVMPFMEAGQKFFIKGEGRFLNTIDRFRKFPKGAVVFMLDEDDPFEAYEAIGDWQSIGTGITADLLQLGTKEQCVDFVKRCFDTMAPGGGFIFMQNKPLLCASDAKLENLIAVYETANELSLKK